MYIVIAIIAFGLLIAIHEVGHFLAARLFGVRVNEFAIGMGPKILKKQGKETLYALRALPIGGFCAMEGEDQDSEDPRAFGNKVWWQQALILIAGALFNFLAGFLVVLALSLTATGFSSSRLAGFAEGYQYQGENGLMAGDRITAIDGERVGSYGDVALLLSRTNGKTADLVIERGGQKITLDDFPMYLQEFTVDGQTVTRFGLNFDADPKTFGNVLKYSWNESLYFIRLVRMGLADLITGAVGIKELSGPVGVVAAINDAGSAAASGGQAANSVAYFCAFIAVNLAVMNLLPIPALDGGRVFFLLVTTLLEKLLRRKISRRVEGYIHGVALVLLMGLMVFTLYNDITKLI
jgi:regulator of sigma E protease